jgi:hypothetical protein
VSDQESLLSNLMRLIPGYGGYRDQESCREDDRLTRQFVVGRLQDCKRALDQLGARAVAAGDLETPAKTEGIRASIDLVQARLKSAVEGYSGWFNNRHVDAQLLRKVGELDASLVSIVDQLDASLAAASGEGHELDESAVVASLDLLRTRIDRRSELLRDSQ